MSSRVEAPNSMEVSTNNVSRVAPRSNVNITLGSPRGATTHSPRSGNAISRNVLRRRIHLTPEMKGILEERFRGWSFECEGGLHPHPLGAIERAICEELAFRDIKRMCGNGCAISDIGGNANRHAIAGRNVHSCNPILCPEDVIRRTKDKYHARANYCHNVALDCSIVPDAYLSVHSLYYQNKEEILELVHRSRKRLLVAVVHRFDQLYGGLHFDGFNYESRYQMAFHGEHLKVTMEVNGNMTSYHHDPMVWLDAAYYSNGRRAMAWNGYKVGDSWIMEFRPAPLGLDCVNKQTLTLLESLRRTDHYGSVAGLMNLNDSKSMTPLLEWVDINDTDVYSYFGFVWLYKKGLNRKILIPKGLIQSVAAKMVGVERDHKALKTCIRHMQSMVSSDKLNVPPDVLVDCKTYGASLAFVYSLDKELIAFNELCKSQSRNKYDRLKQVMGLNELWSFDQKYLLLGAACLTGLIVLTSNPSKVGVGSAVVTSTLLLLNLNSKTKQFSESELTANYNYNRSSSPGYTGSATELWPEGLPGYESNRPLSEPREGSSISVIDVEDSDTKSEMYPILPLFSEYLPVCPSSTVKNEIISLANRACMKVPEPTKEDWDFVIRHAKREIDKIEFIDFDEGAYEKWNSKFLKNRRDDHDRARESLLLEPLTSKDFIRGAFVKREITLKGGVKPEEFDPRCIQGVSHRANVVLGPFMSLFAEQLHKLWNVNNKICYTSGSTAEELGGWRASFGEDEVTIFEIDFSRYDAHQGAECHRLELLFYIQAGIHSWDDAIKVVKAQRKTIGFTAHGARYNVAYTRKSGDPNTSCGNSVLNACVADAIMTSLGLDFRMLVQGDDNLLVVRKRFTAKQKEHLYKTIVERYLKLGFVVKLKILDQWPLAEFCSSIFWPTQDGFVLGPKIGRRLPKFGVSLKRLTQGQIKGMLLGLLKEMDHIPVLRVYVKYCLSKLKKIKTEHYVDRDSPYRVKSASKHSISEDTADFFFTRYGMHYETFEQSLRNALRNSGSDLTTVISYPLLEELMKVDA
nr:polyprotein [Tolivirales sp.]